MDIYQEIKPATLTGIARKALADEERLQNMFIFSRWFEPELTPTIDWEFTLGTDRTYSQSARFRMFDTGPRVGTRPGTSKVSGELPAIGIQYPVTELQALRLRAAGNDAMTAELLLPVVQKDTVMGVQAVERRFEFLRRDLLVDGTATLAEAGIKLTIDVERDPARASTVADDWETIATSTPITDERTVMDVMSDEEDLEPEDFVAVMNRKTWRAWKDSTQTRELMRDVRIIAPGGAPELTDGEAQQIRRDRELPDVVVYNAQALNPLTNVKERLMPDWKVLYLPRFVIGRTQYGIPAMAGEADLEIPFQQQPGPLAYIDKQYTPLNYSTVVDALGVPLLKDADAVYALTVKP